MRKKIVMVTAALLLLLFCGCAREKQVTSLPAPGGTQVSAAKEAPAAQADTAQKGAEGKARHLEYENWELPGEVQLATAMTAVGQAILVGGPAEENTALWKRDFGGASEQLALPEGADYLYALCADEAGGAWLLSGSVPARYFDPMGNNLLMRVEEAPEGRLALTYYEKDRFEPGKTIPVSIPDAKQGARFFQVAQIESGFCLLAGDRLILLDGQGQELARQTVDPNSDGWIFAAMQAYEDTILVLTRNLFGESGSEVRQFDAQTLAPLGETPVSGGAAGLGPALDGGLLLCDDAGLSALDMQTGQVQAEDSARELGVHLEAEQIREMAEGYLLYTPNSGSITFLRWEEGSAPEKSVLQLAIVRGVDSVSYEFTAMVQDFNTSQDRYRIEYEIYSDSEYDNDAASLDVLRTQIMAGQGPDLFAFYSAGFNPPPIHAEAVCADLLPLAGDFLTEESLLPGFYGLLEQDGAVYELPLTVQIDTLIAPARFISEPGVTLEDLEKARAQMPEGWVPVDSWNTPENLFGLCALFCVGAFTDRQTGTCRFDSQEFCDYLAWCKNWGGDGSTPDSPETTLVSLGWISSVSWLAGRGEYYAQEWGAPGYTYAGFPTETGSGSAYNVLTSLGLGPQCRDLDGAKAFFTYCFSYRQENKIPANSALLRTEMEDFMAGNRTDWYGEALVLSEADAAQFYALLETITVRKGQDTALEDILREEAAAYFAGGISAEQAAQNIQSRASVYLKEQYTG